MSEVVRQGSPEPAQEPEQVSRRGILKILGVDLPVAIKTAEIALMATAVTIFDAACAGIKGPDYGPKNYSVKQLVELLQTPSAQYPVITPGYLTDGRGEDIALRTSTGGGNSHYFQDIPNKVAIYALHDTTDPDIKIGVIQTPTYKDFTQIRPSVIPSGKYTVHGDLREVLITGDYTPVNQSLVHNIGEIGIKHPNESLYEWVIDMTSAS